MSAKPISRETVEDVRRVACYMIERNETGEVLALVDIADDEEVETWIVHLRLEKAQPVRRITLKGRHG